MDFNRRERKDRKKTHFFVCSALCGSIFIVFVVQTAVLSVSEVLRGERGHLLQLPERFVMGAWASRPLRMRGKMPTLLWPQTFSPHLSRF